MKVVTLQPVEDERKVVHIKVGKTVIGRGPMLECSDKKVSRNHAQLEVCENGDIFLTPTHVNPCFYLPNNSNTGYEVLKKDCPQRIKHGDSFSLLPNSFRYRVVVSDVSESELQEESSKKDIKKDEPIINGERKDTVSEANHKQAIDDDTPKDNGKPTPVKNGMASTRGRRSDKEASNGGRESSTRSATGTAAAAAAAENNKADKSQDLTEVVTPKEHVGKKGWESKKSARELAKAAAAAAAADRDAAHGNDSHSKVAAASTRGNAVESVSNSNNARDKSPLATKKILSEKGPKKDHRKEKDKADPEKQKQLESFEFKDEEDEQDRTPVAKPAKKQVQKPPPKKAAERLSAAAAASAAATAAVNTSTTSASSRKSKEVTPRRKSPALPTSSNSTRSTRTHRTLIQRISLDDFMASDDEWIATYTSSDEERKKARKRMANRKSSTADASSDEDEWNGRKSKARRTSKKKVNTDDDEDDEDESDAERRPRKGRGRASAPAALKKSPAKKAKKAESDDEDDDDDEEDSEDEAPPPPPKKVAQPPKKAATRTASPLPPKKKIVRRKKSHLYAESEEDFQKQLARAIRESKKEQLRKEREDRAQTTGNGTGKTVSARA